MTASAKVLKFNGRQTVLNMASSGAAFAVNMLLGFFLTPFIVRRIGSTANGFVGLSYNFVTYASLLVIALNSMAGRFIAMAYFQHREEDVHGYYSSVFIADVVICAALCVPGLALLFFLPHVIKVPPELVFDVTVLFAFAFAEFAVMSVGSVYNNSAYVVNRIDLVSSRNIESKVLRLVLVLLLFLTFAPRLWYLGAIYFTCSVYNVARNFFIHRRLMPEVRIRKKFFDFAKVRELVASGVWNSVSSLGSILIGSLDLLIVNLFISAEAMGVVSVAKVIPLCLAGLICSISGTIAPSLTKFYAENDMEKMNRTLFLNMKIMAALFCVPLGFMAVYGVEFYRLWVPSMDARELWLISGVWLVLAPMTLSVQPLAYVFTSADKVKINSLMTIGYAAVSIVAMFFLLRVTENALLKMAIVIGCSKIFIILKDLTFTIPYVARITGSGKWPFFRSLLKNYFAASAVAGICLGASLLGRPRNWPELIGVGILVAIPGCGVCWMLLFNREERERMLGIVRSRLPLKH